MKRCPECRRDYYDDSLAYCLDDGVVLLDGPSTVETEPATAILSDGEGTRRFQPAARPGAVSLLSRYKLSAIIGAVALIAVGGWWFISRSVSRTAPNGDLQLRSIAVLPFKNSFNNADMEYLSDGMAEMLISSLTAVPDLQVKSRSSVYRFKGQDIEPKAIGRELGVDGVVVGTLTQRGNDVILYVELVDATSEKAVWSQT